MSHFSVLVIGDVDFQLQPFHEFECTGLNDEFIKDLNILEEVRAEFLSTTRTRRKGPNDTGFVHDAYDDQFYRDPTPEEAEHLGRIHGSGCGTFNGKNISWRSGDWGDGRGYRAKIYFLPDGWEEKDVPISELMSFAEYASEGRSIVVDDDVPDIRGDHKFGWVRIKNGEAVEVIRRTNPESHWDWWILGGRFAGRFVLKRVTAAAQAPNFSYGWSDEHKASKITGLHVDTALKGEIDFDAMRETAAIEAGREWDAAHSVIRGRQGEYLSWESVRKMHADDLEAARKVYNHQSVVRDLRAANIYDDPEYFMVSRAEFCNKAAMRAVGAWAVVKDRTWLEKGSMGWFGISTGDMSDDEWYAKVCSLIESLPDDTRISIVDCHI